MPEFKKGLEIRDWGLGTGKTWKGIGNKTLFCSRSEAIAREENSSQSPVSSPQSPVPSTQSPER
ncbi:MAG: hypothetical protein V7K50_12155 [Nostoc sp.]|uniref:hypothetical protein n=1 Tax=Nostoc sp. TaxID=1180 RepID=UPI002FF98D36